MDRDLMAGVDLFFSRTNYHKESAYDMDNAGGSFRIGYDLADHIGQVWSYTIAEQNCSILIATHPV